MHLATILLATLLDSQLVCAKYGTSHTPPAAAIAAEKECGESCEIVLAERFANGEEGLPKNLDIAEYFLCRAEAGIAVAEFEGMFEHLQAMKAGSETAPLRFCDHVTSGYGSTYCANLQWDEMMPKLDARIETLRKRFENSARFNALKAKGEKYVQAESTRIGEQSRGGTGYSAITLNAELTEKTQFVEQLERWSSERASSVSTDEAKRADADLNSAYRAAKDAIDEMRGDDIANWKDLLRDAQRAWIAYRDAFAAFYADRWRGAASEQVLRREIVAALTRERTRQLREAY